MIGADCDIVFLSYAEPEAEKNFQNLVTRFPRAKRLHGVTGVGRANKLTSEIIDTDYYFIVDADNEIKNTFDFNLITIPSHSHVIKIWSCQNAVNGLTYGYGGVKLCCRKGMRTLQDNTLDLFGSGNNQVVFDREIASITRFNATPYDAWKAGFRECCMLQAGSGIDMPKEKAQAKIWIWKTKGREARNGKWAIRGAHDGVRYAMQNDHDFVALKKIDNPAWLKNEFILRYSDATGK